MPICKNHWPTWAPCMARRQCTTMSILGKTPCTVAWFAPLAHLFKGLPRGRSGNFGALILCLGGRPPWFYVSDTFWWIFYILLSYTFWQFILHFFLCVRHIWWLLLAVKFPASSTKLEIRKGSVMKLSSAAASITVTNPFAAFSGKTCKSLIHRLTFIANLSQPAEGNHVLQI